MRSGEPAKNTRVLVRSTASRETVDVVSMSLGLGFMLLGGYDGHVRINDHSFEDQRAIFVVVVVGEWQRLVRAIKVRLYGLRGPNDDDGCRHQASDASVSNAIG